MTAPRASWNVAKSESHLYGLHTRPASTATTGSRGATREMGDTVPAAAMHTERVPTGGGPSDRYCLSDEEPAFALTSEGRAFPFQSYHGVSTFFSNLVPIPKPGSFRRPRSPSKVDHRLSAEIETARRSFKNRSFTETTEASLLKYNPHSPILTESPSSSPMGYRKSTSSPRASSPSSSPTGYRKSTASPVTSFTSSSSFRSARGSPRSGRERSPLPIRPPPSPANYGRMPSSPARDELKEAVATGSFFSPAVAAEQLERLRRTSFVGNDGCIYEPGPFEC